MGQSKRHFLCNPSSFGLKVCINIRSNIEVASIPHSIISDPEAIDQSLPRSKAVHSTLGYLLDYRVTSLNNPSLIFCWPRHVVLSPKQGFMPRL